MLLIVDLVARNAMIDSNPFEVKTPEALSSVDAAKLFVDVFTDFHKVKEIGHTFINGPRGTGKSMMLRYLEPDVQLAAKNIKSINELKNYAIHVPIKKAWSDITEWRLLSGSSYYVLAEHIMATHILFMAFKSFNKVVEKECFNNKQFISRIDKLLKMAGHEGLDIDTDDLDKVSIIEHLESVFESEFMGIKQFLRRLLFSNMNDLPYTGAIFSYLDFVVPILYEIKNNIINFDGPFFLLIDDADQLDEGMQKILNTWVSCRTIDVVCLKIATQMRYKTYRTIDDKFIESPHDYSEINISSIYTGNGSKYLSRIKEIVEKRLALVGINSEAEDFFPEDKLQRAEIDRVKSDLISSRTDGKGLGGNRLSDDIIRYAVPIYMTQLAGRKKSSSTYSYAGFKSLVDLSSGIIRWFLDPAAKMFSEINSLHPKRLQETKNAQGNISFIPTDIQDRIIKEWSFEFIDSEFSKLKKSELIDNSNSNTYIHNKNSNIIKLFNLISSLGELFRARLLDENSTERKIFSILIPDEIPNELETILNIAVELGYLQKSSIGSKEGRGRRPKYTLSRRLAPYFKLDPSGYAYNLSVTAQDLMKAMSNPKLFIRDRLNKSEEMESPIQQSLDI